MDFWRLPKLPQPISSQVDVAEAVPASSVSPIFHSNRADGVELAIQPGRGPDWSKVPFEVDCARCGSKLRGLVEPICSACALEFQWAVAVPIEQLKCLACGYHLYGLSETRCPECGGAFTWEHILDDYHRRRKNLFEYRWREAPLRSMASSLRAALRPGSFWRNIDLHDPPKPGPLNFLLLFQVLIAYAFITVTLGTASFLYWVRFYQTNYRGVPKRILSVGFWFESVSSVVLEREFLLAVFAMLSWWALTFLGLLVFQQSMRLCRVRTAHVHRVCVYAVGAGLPIFVLSLTVVTGLILFDVMSFRYLDLLLPVTIGAYILHVTWSVRQGYRHYLKLRHSLAVAVTDQIMALLASMCATLFLQVAYNFVRGWGFP